MSRGPRAAVPGFSAIGKTPGSPFNPRSRNPEPADLLQRLGAYLPFKIGERGVMGLIAVSGYYVLVFMTLNVDRTPVPGDGKSPLKPLPR